MSSRALIYVLQKEVPGLGMLTKVGMSTRSGTKRAKEYGGRDWHCAREYSISVPDLSTLRNIEKRVHQKLESLKCKEAEAFGLHEVFRCNPEIAMAVIKDVVGKEPTIEEEASLLAEQIEKGAVSKLRKKYEAAYAKTLKDGGYSRNAQGWSRSKWRWVDLFDIDELDLGILDLCEEYMEALKRATFADPVFQAMLESQQGAAIQRLEKEHPRSFPKLISKVPASQRRRYRDAKKRMATKKKGN